MQNLCRKQGPWRWEHERDAAGAWTGRSWRSPKVRGREMTTIPLQMGLCREHLHSTQQRCCSACLCAVLPEAAAPGTASHHGSHAASTGQHRATPALA